MVLALTEQSLKESDELIYNAISIITGISTKKETLMQMIP